MMGLQAPAVAWDRSMVLPSPSTLAGRFAQDGRSTAKARAWVEEVIGERLPPGTIGDALKNGVGLCRLINAIQPGTITKIDTSTSPFKQMANISAFIQSCRKLGLRDHALFETLDLFNEKRLPQVVRCLFTLSELVRTNMPEFLGPYLSAPGKPEVDPAVKAVVEISKGNISASGLGGPLSPAEHNTGGSAANGAGAGGGGALRTPGRFPLSLMHQAEQAGGCCLSPARAAGRLTYGVYEGGGGTKTPHGAGSNDSANGSGGSRSAKQGTPEALAAEKNMVKRCGTSSVGESGATGKAGEWGGEAYETAGSTLPVLHTPRVIPTPTKAGLRVEYLMRTTSPSIPRTPRGSSAGDGRMALEEAARRKREATARADAEMEVALWIEGVTGMTFPGKFWSSLKDGVLLCKLVNSFRPGLVPHINKARAPFPEMENITAFLSACRALGVAEHSLFDTRDLHEKRDMEMVVRCLHVLAATVQSSDPDFSGPFLGRRTDAHSRSNARGLRKQLGKGPGARGGLPNLGAFKSAGGICGGSGHIGLGGKRPPAAEVLVEHMDPTATVTPADSPSFIKANRAQAGSDSAAGSELVSPLHSRPCCAPSPGYAAEGTAARTSVITEEGRRSLRWDTSAWESVGGSTAYRRRSRRVEDKGESVVSQIQSFVEHNTGIPWRIKGDMYESLRDGWQLALLANALRPNAIRRIHNSIQPSRQVQNIANFLIASRRMGVARALLFDVDDLHVNRSMTKVARTLLALRVLASNPDFSRERASALTGTSLLVSAVAAAAQTRSETSSSVTRAGRWS